MELEQVPEIISQTIDTIAGKLEVPATQLMYVYGKGIMVEGVYGIFIFLLCIGISIGSAFGIFKSLCLFLEEDEDIIKINTSITLIYTLAIIFLFSFIGIIISLSGDLLPSIQKILTPDYYLLTKILSKINL